MNLKKITVIFIILMSLIKNSFPNALNDISVGTRPSSLGHSFVGIADDANANFHNTAGTAYMPRSELTFQNIFFKNSLNSFNFISFSHIMGKYGTLNFGGIKSSLNDKLGNINYFNCGYGKRIFWFLTGGINLKYCNQLNNNKKNNQVDIDISIYIDPTLSKKKEIQELIEKTEKFINKSSDSSLKLGKAAFYKKKYVEAIRLFQESLKFNQNNKEAREYFKKCCKITGLSIQLPLLMGIKSEPVKGDFSLEERETLAEKEYQNGLEYYYNENYMLALKSWQRALDILFVNYTVDRMKLGISLQNLLKHKYYEYSNLVETPIQLKLGISYAILKNLKFITEFYKFEGENNKLGVNTGIEVKILNYFSLRGGMRFAQPITFQNIENQYTTGVGLHYKNYFFDYSYEPKNKLYYHSISLSIKFGMSKEEEALNFLNQGILYAKTGKIEEAEEKWKQALLLDPSQVIARKYLKGEVGVKTLIKKTQEELSNEVFQKGLLFYNKKDYLNARAYFFEALIISSENDKARAYLDKTKGIINNLITDLFIRGNDYLAKGDSENAVLSFRKILQYDFQNKKAKELLSNAKEKFQEQIITYKNNSLSLYKEKKCREALKNIELFLKYEPEDEEGRELKYKIDNAIEKERLFALCNELYNNGNKFFNNGECFKAKEMYLEVKNNCFYFKDNERKIELVNQKIHLEEKIKEKLLEADKYYQEGLEQFKFGNYKSAQKSFNHALKLNPELIKAQSYVKECESKIILSMKKDEQIKKAKELYNKSLELIEDEKYSSALNKLYTASTFDDKNELIKNKIIEVQDIINLKIDKPYHDGIKYFNEGKLSKAIEKWNYVLKIQPEHTLARTYLDQAINQKEASIKVHNKSGQKYLKNKDYVNAMKEFREVLALDPENEIAAEGAGIASGILKDKIEAFYNKGENLFNKNRFVDAGKEFQNALNLDPGYIMAVEYKKKCAQKINRQSKKGKINLHLSKGKEYFKNRIFIEAKKEFLKILILEPDNQTAKELVKECENKIKELKNKDKISEIFNKVAKHYRKEDYKNALKLLQDINKLDPDNELIKRYIKVTEIKWNNYCDGYYAKAKKMEEEGDFFTARNFYQKVYKSNPEYKDVKFILDRFNLKITDYVNETRNKARELYKEKDYGEAYVLWDRIAKLRPNDREAVKYVRITASKSGKIIEGRKIFKHGEKFFKGKKWVNALIQFNKSITLNPALKNKYNKSYKKITEKSIKNKLNTILNNGINKYNNKDYVKAMDYLNIIFQISPENERARKYYYNTKSKLENLSKSHFKKSQNYLKRKNVKNAYKEIKLSMIYAPQNEEIRNFHQEVKKEYSKKWEKRERKYKGNIDALLFEGIRLYRTGDLKKAIAKWKKVIAVDPNNGKVKNYIARAKSKLKKLGGD